MVKQRFLSHAHYSHGSAYDDYEEAPVRLPKASNIGLSLGLLMVIGAIAGLLTYYIM